MSLHIAPSPVSAIELQVMWNRLIALVEQQAQTLMRTAFSPIVRESGDLSAGIFDVSGRMLAQARTGTPGHINTMAQSVGKFLTYFPSDAARLGDVYVTNDPWIGTGHLNDYVVVTPAFHAGQLVGYFACTGHMTDVGGIGLSPDGRDIFWEGVRIPPMKLVDGGQMNETLIAIAKANSRMPFELEGDVYSLVASNDTAARHLSEMLSQTGQRDIALLADHIVQSSRNAMAKRIADLPPGSAHWQMTIDGFEAPVELVARLTIEAQRVSVDWAGSSGASQFGINVPLGYAAAYTTYALACAIAPDVPNNAGTLSMFDVTAPEGSIVNARSPQPVACRHTIGGLLPDVVFGCFDQLCPGRVPAESASALWTLTLQGGGTRKPYTISVITNGGTGARPRLDGLAATSFPSAVRGTPVEMVEAATPLIFWQRELRPDSGGAGAQRGGLGQQMQIGTLDGQSFSIAAAFDRIAYPARGRNGGENGAAGRLALSTGRVLRGKGAQSIAPDERLVVHTPGGGGYGDKAKRNSVNIEADLQVGYVTGKQA